jgi:hypothetical protein
MDPRLRLSEQMRKDIAEALELAIRTEEDPDKSKRLREALQRIENPRKGKPPLVRMGQAPLSREVKVKISRMERRIVQLESELSAVRENKDPRAGSTAVGEP